MTNVFQFSQPGTFADPLTEVLRNGARALLARAVEAEVAALLGCHADKLTANGHQRVVRHGHLPEACRKTTIALRVLHVLVQRRAVGQRSRLPARRARSCTPHRRFGGSGLLQPLP